MSCVLGQVLVQLQQQHGIAPDNVDIVMVNSMQHHHVASNDGTFTISSSRPQPAAEIRENRLLNVATLQQAKCTWNGCDVPAVVISHELAHVFSCFPFLGSQPVTVGPGNTLLVHFDGAASEGNFSAWSYDPKSAGDKLHLLECHWKLARLSKYFNENGLAFAIVGASKDQHLSVPGKLMGLQAFGTLRPELKRWMAKHEYFLDCWSDAARKNFVLEACQRFGWTPLNPENPFDPKDTFLQDIAKTFQWDFTDTFVEAMAALQKQTGAKQLLLAGGCALSICTVSRLEESGLFDMVFVPPCCSDTVTKHILKQITSPCTRGTHTHFSEFMINPTLPCTPFHKGFGCGRCRICGSLEGEEDPSYTRSVRALTVPQ